MAEPISYEISIKVNTEELDMAIEKAKKLKELLLECTEIEKRQHSERKMEIEKVILILLKQAAEIEPPQSYIYIKQLSEAAAILQYF